MKKEKRSIKQVPHPRRTQTANHFGKLGAVHGEEGNAEGMSQQI
jgi:hypothetical protein